MRMLIAATVAAFSIPAAPALAANAVPAVAVAHTAEAFGQDRFRDHGRDRQARNDWRRYRNYDHNRLPRGVNRYYADDYYRDGRYYRERRLTRNDRIYRGRDGRYYCRRNDGTTGLIVGGVAGGLLGNALSSGGNATLGTLLGAAAGAALGHSVDRDNNGYRNLRCR